GLGAVVGWWLARWGLAAVLKLGTEGLPRLENVHLDVQVAGFSILVTVVTGIAFGLAPAWFASRVSLGEVLKDAARGTTAGGAEESAEASWPVNWRSRWSCWWG